MASSEFESLQQYLADPAKAGTRQMWESLVNRELGPEDRATMNAMAPTVTSYLSGEIDRAEYERRMSALSVPQP